MMRLNLVRYHLSPEIVLGTVYIDLKFRWYSLEDGLRNVKIAGRTCIPPGEYKLSYRMSPHLKREVVWITNVPDFEYVYLHNGTTTEDTDGCVLVGKAVEHNTENGTRLLYSRKACEELEDLLLPRLKTGEEIVLCISRGCP